jgi:maltose alpha-D-glucosyltransferase / alpha-amylase
MYSIRDFGTVPVEGLFDMSAAREPWYKNAVIYGIDVATFQDSNGDGIGDFPGLCNRLDYLSELGVTCLWLLPFFPTPNRDNGYDVKNYYEVDSRLGTFDDFVRLVHRAGERGIRVLIDLVMDHTSDEHPWFQAARRDRGSRYRRYYEWSDAPPSPKPDKGNVFPGEESSVWTYDDVAGQYYFHRFYSFEPDLDVMCQDVRDEIERVIDFWLSFGISGFRVDAVSHMIEAPHKAAAASLAHDPHQVIRDIRAFTSRRRPDAMLLGEADVEPHHLKAFFGDGDELHMLYNFLLNNYLFLALAQGQSAPLQRALRLLPHVPPDCQWVNFLRNFDELDLERLSDNDREAVYQAFAPEPTMKIFGRGIRRRLAPMLEEPRRIRTAYSLLFSLAGAPLFMYGDEIGMGDDLSLPGRDAVRTPMQWSQDRNAGFSTAPSQSLAGRVIPTGAYGYTKVNVADQSSDPDSLLAWMKRLIQVRRQCPEWGWGACTILETDEPSIVAHCAEWQDSALLAVHNLADKACSIRVGHDPEANYVPVWGNGRCLTARASVVIELEPYGYAWYRLVRDE